MQDFDFLNPDYTAVYAERAERLAYIRKNPAEVPKLKAYYRDHIAQFLSDWACTVDPRNPEIGLPSVIPFILFPRQVEWVDWFLDRWKNREPGITDKSRDMGASWLAVSTAATICMFNEGIVAGFGSRKESYVDASGDPKALFWKAREFLRLLPSEFTGQWDATHMRISFGATGSVMTGEAGDNIGRGDRTSFFIVDESAHLERPKLIDNSLSATTNCRIDMSSVNGMDNPFAQKRWGGKISVCTLHWRQDPRKNDAWYEKQKNTLDPVTLAQEVDISYSASKLGILIPSDWVQAAVDADRKLLISPTGVRKGALDVADEGTDENAFAVRHGILLDHLESWKGIGSDIMATVERAFLICDTLRIKQFDYDADGLGAGVRGDARVINERRETQGMHQVVVLPFQGSGSVDKPDAKDKVSGRLNKDMFANRKAQAWWSLRYRFQQTYRAVVEKKVPDNLDDLISLPPDLGCLGQLCVELSQPTYSINGAGKILVDKAPECSKSPNLADAVNEVYASSVIPQSEKDKKKYRTDTQQPFDSSMGHLG
jgi:hypothetical protein